MLRDKCRGFLAAEDGGVAIEYALIAGIVSIAVVSGLYAIKASLQDMFTKVNDAFQ